MNSDRISRAALDTVEVKKGVELPGEGQYRGDTKSLETDTREQVVGRKKCGHGPESRVM
jgi:hypothetical protein